MACEKENVAVLLSTYNGTKFLGEQLASVYAQEGVAVSLLVRDDGSRDGTCALLDEEQAAGRLSWYTGENKGPAYSFWDLLQQAPQSDFYAFCDQDDVWDSDKLRVAVDAMRGDGDAPALYFCQTRLVDESLAEIKSVKINPLLTNGEALIYNFVTGCTMVMNDALRRELVKFTPRYIRMHDIWVYNVAQAIGARVHFDATPRMSYRQHGGNVVGQKKSLAFQWKNRWERLCEGEHIRCRLAQELLNGYAADMSAENRSLTELVAGYRAGFLPWLKLLFTPRLRCAPLSINLSARVSVLFRIF